MRKRTDESRAALYSWYSSTGWRPSEQYGYSGYSGYSGAGMVTVQSAGVDKSAERERLDKEIAKVEEELRTVETKLSNKSFVDRAPKAVVEEHRQRRANFAEQVRKLKEARDRLD
jgi:valyl-tRNA synthetase